jgi:hypothetical protein
MAFKLHAQMTVVRLTYRELPVANGVTISNGDAVRLVNGRFQLCLTNETVFGVSCTVDDVTGNAAGTTTIQAIMAYGVLWEADQGALTDAVTQPGDMVDINGTSDGVTTVTNSDFRIWQVDRQRNKVYGTFQDVFV